jgi:hypothetical protein
VIRGKAVLLTSHKDPESCDHPARGPWAGGAPRRRAAELPLTWSGDIRRRDRAGISTPVASGVTEAAAARAHYVTSHPLRMGRNNPFVAQPLCEPLGDPLASTPLRPPPSPAPGSGAGYLQAGFTLVDADRRWGCSLPKLDVAYLTEGVRMKSGAMLHLTMDPTPLQIVSAALLGETWKPGTNVAVCSSAAG